MKEYTLAPNILDWMAEKRLGLDRLLVVGQEKGYQPEIVIAAIEAVFELRDTISKDILIGWTIWDTAEELTTQRFGARKVRQVGIVEVLRLNERVHEVEKQLEAHIHQRLYYDMGFIAVVLLILVLVFLRSA